MKVTANSLNNLKNLYLLFSYRFFSPYPGTRWTSDFLSLRLDCRESHLTTKSKIIIGSWNQKDTFTFRRQILVKYSSRKIMRDWKLFDHSNVFFQMIFNQSIVNLGSSRNYVTPLRDGEQAFYRSFKYKYPCLTDFRPSSSFSNTILGPQPLLECRVMYDGAIMTTLKA